MAWIEKDFDGSDVLRRWFNQPLLSIFQKKKPQKAKKIPTDVIVMVDNWIDEGEKQRQERINENKKEV
jgi:hypothetical protein